MTESASARNCGNAILEDSYAHYAKSLDVIVMHLRDARNILAAVCDAETSRVLAKAVILLASASVESNLASLGALGAMLAEKYNTLAPIQIDYLLGIQEVIDDQGNPRTKPLRHALERRLRTVPALLGQILGIEFKYPEEDVGNIKLKSMIAYRDALVHPRWQRYLYEVGRRQAEMAVDAAEWYLELVATTFAPFLNYYKRVLYDMLNCDGSSPGPVAKRVASVVSDDVLTTMPAVGFVKVAIREWFDMVLITEFALGSECEGDSDGSMLTRAGLVVLYAMLDAQLALNAQNYLYDTPTKFSQSEILFLAEAAIEIDTDGNVTAEDAHENFKKRVIGIPRVLARKVVAKDITVSLGDDMGAALLRFKDLRDAVMHPRAGQPLPRVSKPELREAAAAIRKYFARLSDTCPELFGLYQPLLCLGQGKKLR